ncbi:hypothetical protein LTR28_001035, partial [Elasticomyces elasticus]
MASHLYSKRLLYYDGKAQRSRSRQTFQSIDPSDGLPIADIEAASQPDVDAAISSAESAFQSWSATPPIARSRILLRAVAILRERNNELAEIETRDTGKPFTETSTVDV